jgi:hypothetical protein
MNGPYISQFQAAINKEYASLDNNQVFIEVESLPPGFSALGTKMVLKIKETAEASMPLNFKARLCGQGFNQIYGIDYNETFAPVACFDALRVFITILASMDFEIDTVDVITAFLLAPLKEEVYIKIPDGYKTKSRLTKFLRLLKALYGLKQAPYAWNKEISEFLISIGFKQLIKDRCIFVGKINGKLVYILLYVDDAIIGCKTRDTMIKVKTIIDSKFKITDKGPIKFFLNMHFIRDRKSRTIQIHQWSKIDRLIKEFLPEGKPTKLPADPSVILSKTMCPTSINDIKNMEKFPFRRLIGILLHIALTARPDILTAVSSAGKFSHNPGMEHWEALIRVVKYLIYTKEYTFTLGGILPNSKIIVRAYSDADWAGDIDIRHSRTGMAIYIGNSLVIFSSRLQRCISLSTMEAETNAGCETAQRIMWLLIILKELGFEILDPVPMFEDNASCITTSSSWKAHNGTRHYELKQYYLRQKVVDSKEIRMVKVSTENMTADIFTKQLSFILFSKHRKSLGIMPYVNPSLGSVGVTCLHQISIHPL